MSCTVTRKKVESEWGRGSHLIIYNVVQAIPLGTCGPTAQVILEVSAFKTYANWTLDN